MSEKLCTVLLRRELLSGRNAGRKNSTPEDSRLCFMPSAARCLAAMRRVAVYIISRPTVSVCAIRSSTPKACVLLPAWSRPDARLPLARASNAPVCTGPFEAPMPSSLSAVQNSVVVFKTSGSADQNPGPHDPSLSWRAPGPGATGNCSTIHTKVTGGSGKGKCFTLPNGGRVDTASHVYGEIWSANMIQFYVDDSTPAVFVVIASDLPSGDVWPFSSSADSFFLIMNMAVGGTLGAQTDSAHGSQSR